MQSSNHPHIQKFFLQLSLYLEKTNISLADELNISQKEFEKFLFGLQDINTVNLLRFCSKHFISMDMIVKEGVDIKALASKLEGKDYYLDSKYLKNARSKIRAINYILDFVEATLGEIEKFRICRKLQLSEKTLQNSDTEVNAQLALDLCDYLYKKAKNPNYLEAVGRNFYKNTVKTPLGLEISKARNLQELHELVFNNLISSHIENNFKWKIQHMDNQNCIVHGVPTNEYKEERKNKLIANTGITYLRKGFIASLPQFIGMGPTQSIKLEKSPIHGDSYYRMNINFNSIPCAFQ